VAGRKLVVAGVPANVHQFIQQGRQAVHRVVQVLRERRVALDPVDLQAQVDRATPPHPHRVAERLAAGWLADQAVVGPPPAPSQFFHDPRDAIHRLAFLVAGQQQADLAAVRRVLAHKRLEGDDHRRDRALHVRHAAAVQLAIYLVRAERQEGPELCGARRHHVGMAEEPQRRRAAAARQQHVADRATQEPLDVEAKRQQAFGDQALAAGVVGRDRRPGGQFAGEVENAGVNRHGAEFR
jgi:hypothetical protein